MSGRASGVKSVTNHSVDLSTVVTPLWEISNQSKAPLGVVRKRENFKLSHIRHVWSPLKLPEAGCVGRFVHRQETR